MTDLTSTLTGAFLGFAGSALLMYVRDIYLHSKRTREQHRRAIIERQLEKLYSPLYRFIKSSELLVKHPTIAVTVSSEESKRGEEGRQKEFLDSIIENYLYLAEDDLMVLLPRLHGVAFWQKENEETMTQLVKHVVSQYEKLRKEYFSFGASDDC